MLILPLFSEHMTPRRKTDHAYAQSVMINLFRRLFLEVVECIFTQILSDITEFILDSH